jgi:hypothetical protein
LGFSVASYNARYLVQWVLIGGKSAFLEHRSTLNLLPFSFLETGGTEAKRELFRTLQLLTEKRHGAELARRRSD